MMRAVPATVAEVQDAVRTASTVAPDHSAVSPGLSSVAPGFSPASAARPAIRIVASGTKTALSTPREDDLVLDLSRLSGVLEYQPEECTFTAAAGTVLREIQTLLEPHGQYLPFDPPFAPRGATLGGTVAAGLSGPGRYRYGGVRDFVLGARFVDGEGCLVRSGGKVVKNAAGFYLHHLLIGSVGRLGALVEISCKVFPRAAARLTIVADCTTLERALDAMVRLRRSPFELESMDLAPPGTLFLRLGGVESGLRARAAAVAKFIGVPLTEIGGADDDALWRDARELAWATGTIVKIGTTPSRLTALDGCLSSAPRRYSCGGDVAWVGWSANLADLDRALLDLGLSGLAIVGSVESPWIGVRPNETFLGRARQALDPAGMYDDRKAVARRARL